MTKETDAFKGGPGPTHVLLLLFLLLLLLGGRNRHNTSDPCIPQEGQDRLRCPFVANHLFDRGPLGASTCMPSRSPSTFCASGVPGPCTWQSDGSAAVALHCHTSRTHSARFCGSCCRGKVRSTRAPKGTGSIVWPGPSAQSSAPFLFVTVGGWYRRLLLRPFASLHPSLSSRPSRCGDTFVGVSAGSLLRFVGCPYRDRHGVMTPSLRRGDVFFTVVGCRVSGPRPSAEGLGPRLHWPQTNQTCFDSIFHSIFTLIA